MKPMTFFLPGLLALLITGCASLVDDSMASHDRTLPVPPTLPALGVAGSAAASDTAVPGWRDVIADARLRSLVELALENNRDLQIAARNIEAARAQFRIRDAARGPTVKAGAEASAARSAADLGSTGRAVTNHQYSVSLGVAAWELDLWGRLERLKQSALANYLATEQARRSVQASLVAELAQAWLTLAADRGRVALTEETLASRRTGLDLMGRRKALGAATALDLATAEAAAETARGDLASARLAVSEDLNLLRLLVGTEPPVHLLPAAREGGDAAALVAVPADLPSTVLLQRPDVRGAELTLEAARADVSAARAAMLPTISLTASAGTASRSLSTLFTAGNGTWSFGPSISLPIFDGGASRAAWEQARATHGAQLAAYEKTIQTAFREVADALAMRASLAERLAAQQAQVTAYETTLRLTTERQRAGAESAIAVLDAQRSLWDAQQSLITLQLAEQTNRLTLFKALGGA